MITGALGVDHPEGGPLLHPNLTGAVAVRTDLHGRAVFCAGAVTGVTAFHLGNSDLLSDAAAGLKEGNTHLRADVAAPAGRIGVGTPGASAAEAAEEALKDVAQIAHVKAAEVAVAAGSSGSAAKGRIHARMAELIVAGTLLRIGKNLIGLIYFLELFLSVFITGVQVGMVFFCHLAIGFFELIFRAALLHAEHFIIITFFSQWSFLHFPCDARKQPNRAGSTPAPIGPLFAYLLSLSTSL